MYHAGSYLDPELAGSVITVAAKIPRDAPELPSLTQVWPSCEYHERETYEMFGIIFRGHPKLKRLLLPEWWSDIPPLRKDYKPPGR
jgi:NADH-quinone oxidoreductase subunit C